jgi:hypothetical protein
MPGSHDLTGRWTGHYLQHGQPHPIAVELVQRGEHLAGAMADGSTVFTRSVSEMAMAEGLPPGADEQIVARLREQWPDAPPGPVVAESELPPTSQIEGEVVGDAVTFHKTYDGTHFAGFRVGDVRVGVMTEGHSVQYRGHVRDNGRLIEGRWTIPSEPGSGRGRIEGEFQLQRAGEPGLV